MELLNPSLNNNNNNNNNQKPVVLAGSNRLEQLPNEIIVNLMVHTEYRTLMNLVYTGAHAANIWRTHWPSIFWRMQVVQFPEFINMFGDVPIFCGACDWTVERRDENGRLKSTENSTQVQRASQASLGLEVSGAPQSVVSVPSIHPRRTRTGNQIRQLREIVFSMVMNIGPFRITGVPLRQWLLDNHGWNFLNFLNCLQEYLARSVSLLKASKLGGLGYCQWWIDFKPGLQSRLAMLTLNRWYWRTRVLETPAAISSEATMCEVVNNQVDMFNEQPAKVRVLVIDIVRFVMHSMESFLNVEQRVTDCLQRYARARNSQPHLLDRLRHGKRLWQCVTGHILASIVRANIPSMIRELEGWGTDSGRSAANDHLCLDLNLMLFDQVERDIEAAEGYSSPTIRAREGLRLAEGIGYATREDGI